MFHCDIDLYEKYIDLFHFACLSCLHMFLKSEVYLHMSRMSFPGFNHILRTDMMVTYNFAAFMSLIKSKNRERVEYLYNVQLMFQWCSCDTHTNMPHLNPMQMKIFIQGIPSFKNDKKVVEKEVSNSSRKSYALL